MRPLVNMPQDAFQHINCGNASLPGDALFRFYESTPPFLRLVVHFHVVALEPDGSAIRFKVSFPCQGTSTLNVRTSLIETFPASSMASTYQR